MTVGNITDQPYGATHGTRREHDMAMTPQDRIAILGWGSLIWDPRHEFDEWHTDWRLDGPELPIEFSRISSTRGCALTLVIDEVNGARIQVAWCLSKRRKLVDAVCDLRCREGTTDANIGRLVVPSERDRDEGTSIKGQIVAWAKAKDVHSVVWTSLSSNFEREKGKAFSVGNAIVHLQELGPEQKAKAAEYVWRAPPFVRTPLRRALEIGPWFVTRAEATGSSEAANDK